MNAINIGNDTMRGLFFIIKGRHVPKLPPTYINKVNGEVGYLGGYDPHRECDEDWYFVMDRKCYHSIYGGHDFDKAVKAIYKTIVKFKGVAKNYFREVSRLTSDDYYEVHYLGHSPLTPERRAKKCEGRCPRTSPIMADMYRNIDSLWGNVFEDYVVEQEDLAYRSIEDDKPLNKSRRLVNKARKSIGLVPVSQEVKKPLKRVEKREDATTTAIRPVTRKSVKLLRV